MIYQRENGLCTGKGFSNVNANGFLAKFKTWVTQAYPNGPGWTIIDDQSMDGAGTLRWGYVDTSASSIGVGTSFDTLAEIAAITNGSFRITIGDFTADVTGINFTGVTTWEGVAAVIQAKVRLADASAEFTASTCNHFMNRSTTGNAILYHRFNIVAGVRGVAVSNLSATGSGTDISGDNYLRMRSDGSYPAGTAGIINPYIVVCSSSTPSWDDNPPNKYIQIGDGGTAGQIYVAAMTNWSTTAHTSFGRFEYSYITTGDDLEFIYDFRGGNEMMVIQSFIASTWYSFVLDSWVGDPVLVEDISIRGVTTAAVTTAMNSVTLGTDEGAQFTAGESYFLIDLDESESFQYMTIATGGIAGDIITFTANFNMEAKAGAILSPYYHRFYTMCPTSAYDAHARLPYVSTFKRERGISSSYSSDTVDFYGEIMTEYLTYMDPDDSGIYACMKLGIVEIADSAQGNRAYGSTKNVYACSVSGMASATDGKTINGKNFLYFKRHNEMTYSNNYNGNSSIAILIPDYNEGS